jgi:hypothetical protein
VSAQLVASQVVLSSTELVNLRKEGNTARLNKLRMQLSDFATQKKMFHVYHSLTSFQTQWEASTGNLNNIWELQCFTLIQGMHWTDCSTAEWCLAVAENRPFVVTAS